jgi:hypothetical protein
MFDMPDILDTYREISSTLNSRGRGAPPVILRRVEDIQQSWRDPAERSSRIFALPVFIQRKAIVEMKITWLLFVDAVEQRSL